MATDQDRPEDDQDDDDQDVGEPWAEELRAELRERGGWVDQDPLQDMAAQLADQLAEVLGRLLRRKLPLLMAEGIKPFLVQQGQRHLELADIIKALTGQVEQLQEHQIDLRKVTSSLAETVGSLNATVSQQAQDLAELQRQIEQLQANQ
jgi:hypothetical protein